MGRNGDPADNYNVKTGSFSGWTVSDEIQRTNGTFRTVKRKLIRNFGSDPSAPTLPTQNDIDSALTIVPYDSPPWDRSATEGFRNRLEGWINAPQLHNRVHVWVGGLVLTVAGQTGSMGLMSSPNDPTLFLHQSNIDRIWAQWQDKHPDQDYPPSGSIKDQNGMSIDGQDRNDKLHPWDDTTFIFRE